MMIVSFVTIATDDFEAASRVCPVDKVASGASMWYNNHEEE